MKILHYNIHMWRDPTGASNLSAVTELLKREAPDVVSLVEVDEPWGRPDGLRRIADTLGYSWVYVPAFEYQTKGGFGNALLSRTPLRAVQQWQLLPPRLYDGTEPSEPRAVVLARTHVNGYALWVGATHLPHQDAALRTQASQRLLQLLGQLKAPWIVCGDFNQPPAAWLPPSADVQPDPPVATYPAAAPTDPIDYCVLKGVTAQAQVLELAASDHLPVVIHASSG